MSESASVLEVTVPDPDRELDPRVIPQQRLVRRFAALVITGASLLVLLIVFLAADGLPGWARAVLGALWLVLMIALTWQAEAWPAKAYAHTRYRLDADGLVIRRGVYWRSTTYVPRSRVQHTDVSQGPLERHYGLGTLVVFTAGTSHARISLPGLAHEVAMALRDDLRMDRHDDVV